MPSSVKWMLIVIGLIAGAISGLVGGLWVWKPLAAVGWMNQLRWILFPASLLITVAAGAGTVATFWTARVASAECLARAAWPCLFLLYLVAWYLLGFDASILPRAIGPVAVGILVALVAGALIWGLFRTVRQDPATPLPPLLVLAVGLFSASLAFFLWELIQNRGLIVEGDRLCLVILSALTTCILLGIVGYSLWATGHREEEAFETALRRMFAFQGLFFNWMAWYLVALVYRVFHFKPGH